MARTDLHFRLRLPPSIKSLVEQAAVENHRSMTAEIIARLERSFAEPVGSRVAETGSMTGIAQLPESVSMDDLAEALDRARRQATHQALRELGIVVRPFDSEDSE